MNCHLYLRKGTVYVPTMGKMGEGFYRGVEPVTVVSVARTEQLQRTLQSTIARGNPIVPTLRRSEIQPPVLLKYAGVRSWSVFERDMMFWIIEERESVFKIAGQSKQPDGGWIPDPAQTTTFPAGTSVDDVIERMIVILQDAQQ